MSGPSVHDAEMPAPDDFDERAIEAFLAGRRVTAAEVGPLAAFADDLRSAVSGPPPAPGPELARLLREGFSIDHGELPATAGIATRPSPEPAGPSTTRRRNMTISELLAALTAKLAGLGLAAKAALGLGVATASVTAAGAAGVLPDPVQQAVATVVNAATPLNIPDGTDDDLTSTITEGPGDLVPNPGDLTGTLDDVTGTVDDATGTVDDVDGVDGVGGVGGVGGGQPANHGACVSAVAKNAPRGPGGVHGQAVSAAAKACPKPNGAGGDDTTATTTTTTTTILDDVTDDVTGSADAGARGRGQNGPGKDRGQSGQPHGKAGRPGR